MIWKIPIVLIILTTGFTDVISYAIRSKAISLSIKMTDYFNVGPSSQVLEEPSLVWDCFKSCTRICDLEDTLAHQTDSITTALHELETNHPLRITDGNFNSSYKLRVFIDILIVDSIGSEDKSLYHNWTGDCIGNVLFVMSLQSKMIHFFTSDRHIQQVLTNDRVDTIWHDIIPMLHLQKYKKAVVYAIEQFIKYVDQGPPINDDLRPPTFPVQFSNLILCTFMVFIFAYAYNSNLMRVLGLIPSNATEGEREINERSEAKSLFAKKIAGGKRLIGERCSICLNDFRPCKQVECVECSNSDNDTTILNSHNHATYLGNDNRPIHILRCNHAFCVKCWQRRLRNSTLCPICRQDSMEHQQYMHAYGSIYSSDGEDTSGLSHNVDLDEERLHQHMSGYGDNWSDTYPLDRSYIDDTSDQYEEQDEERLHQHMYGYDGNTSDRSDNVCLDEEQILDIYPLDRSSIDTSDQNDQMYDQMYLCRDQYQNQVRPDVAQYQMNSNRMGQVSINNRTISPTDQRIRLNSPPRVPVYPCQIDGDSLTRKELHLMIMRARFTTMHPNTYQY